MPPPMYNRGPRGWRERWMHRFGMDVVAAPLRKGERTIPNWLTGKAMAFFFVTMLACWVVFGHIPPFKLWFTAALSVVLFFYGSRTMADSFAKTGEKTFLKHVFWIGVLVRVLFVLYMFLSFNPEHFGNTNGDNTDTLWYVSFGNAIAQWVQNGFDMSFSDLCYKWGSTMDDVGYPMWLAVIYIITDGASDVFIPMLVKCFVSAYCAISIYRVARRHYGEGVARITAIFICLNPNMIYWCGVMFKEAEMVFLVCLAVDNIDKVLSSGKQYTFKALLPGILAGVSLFFFRMALGMVFFLAVFAHIIMASQRVMSLGKKILAGVLVGAVLMVAIGDRILMQTREVVETVQSDSQQKNMEWRAERKDGSNSFAKYAGAAVFAPLIFTIPFPTFNQAEESQLLQVQLAGGSYIKNIFSFFVILVMFMMLISGEWRRHVFIIAYTLGYLMCLVLSSFAHSGRFHMPIWPMLMLFAAYGIQIAKTNARVRKWWPMVLVLEVVVCLAWNWFKLKGRGMI